MVVNCAIYLNSKMKEKKKTKSCKKNINRGSLNIVNVLPVSIIFPLKLLSSFSLLLLVSLKASL